MENICLTSHDQHLRMLNILENRTRTIEIVQICGEDLTEPLIKAAIPFLKKRGIGSVPETGFGLDDIAFLDSSGAALFYTTTHEGDAYITAGLLKELDG